MARRRLGRMIVLTLLIFAAGALTLSRNAASHLTAETIAQPPARHLLPVKPLFHASHVLRLHFLGSGRRYARAEAKMTCAFRQNVLP